MTQIHPRAAGGLVSSRGPRSYSALCWLGFVVILLHNIEEALTAPDWVAEHGRELQARFGFERIPAGNRQALYSGLLVLTVIVLLWIIAASRARSRTFGVYSIAFLFFTFFYNALVPHLAGAVILQRYVPGVWTAVLLVIPFTVLWSIQAFRHGWVSGSAFCFSAAGALLFYALAVGPLLGVR